MLDLVSVEKCTDRTYRLSPELWAKAALLGEARRLSNKARSPSSDRGYQGNRDVDTVGAAGELIILELLRRNAASDAVVSAFVSNMFTPEGGRGSKGADFQFIGRDGSLQNVDAKTFDCKPNKKKFAINSEKHKSLGSIRSWYVGILIPQFGDGAAISSLIPHSDVDQWEFGFLKKSGPNPGSPSMNIDIDRFRSKYFSSATLKTFHITKEYPPSKILDLANEIEFRENFFDLLPLTKKIIEKIKIAI